MKGFIALNVLEKKTGKIIRRVIAETARDKGPIAEPWDLQDEAKQFVPPGDYDWTAVACPPLTLTYQTTVNNAGHPPWWAPVRGGGGWMADESPPASVCTLGKKMLLLGSVVCEKGQVGIATDLEGNKLWGESPVLTGWGGGDRIASDGRYGYLINHYGIERVDPEQANFNPTEVLKFSFSREVPGGAFGGSDLGGAAVRGDKLYVAFHAPPVPWITPAPQAEDFALLQCLPLVRKTHEYPEANYDDITRFFSAFLVSSPNDRRESSFGDAPTAGALSGTLTVTFNKPITVGTVLVPNAHFKVYALKPGKVLAEDNAAGPDNPDAGVGDEEASDKFSEDLWEPLTMTGQNGRPGLALAKAGGIVTRALRYEAPRLEYCLVMNHRFRDVAPEATRVYGEGEKTDHGGWVVQRPARPLLTADNPARMALVWPAPVALRGVSFHLPTTASMAVDSWIGPASDDPGAHLADDEDWKSLGQIEIEIDRYWARTASVRNLDFAGEVTTRALRLRAVLAADVLGVQGFRKAVTGAQHAGFDAILAYSALGDDNADIPKPLNERLSEYQLPADGQGRLTLLRHLPLANPGYLAVGKDGALLAVSAGRVVAVPLAGTEKPREVVAKTQLAAPAGIAVDADGLLYVVDQGPQVIKVFDPAGGKLLRTIGTPGGFKVGPWDPTRFDNPVDIAIDGNGKLWVAEGSIQPKRVSRWTRDGKIEKWFLGPTMYGGGGFMGGGAWMDPHDRSVVNFDGMKFVVNWQDYSWKLADILYRPGVNGPEHSATPNRVVYVQGRRYLLGDPRVYNNIAVICTEKNGVAVPMAAAGTLGSWSGLDHYPGFKEAFANLSREGCGFVWTDTNGDGIPQVSEIQVTDKTPLGPTYCASCVGEDLSFNFHGWRLRPTGFTAGGAPTYDINKLEEVPALSGQSTWTTEDGGTFTTANAMLTPEGKSLWEIRDPAPGVNRSGAPRLPGVPVAQFEVVGHVKVAGEELFVTNGNYGDWFVTTRDGLMPIWIFGGPPGYGHAHWTMPECIPGKTQLTDVRMDAEDFCGTITRADDGHVYLIAGGNHNSIVRVDGLEGMVRLHGSLTVTKDDLEKARAWQVKKAAIENELQEPKIDTVSYADNEDIVVDGVLDEWAPYPFMTVHEHHDDLKGDVPDAQVALAYNGDNLYVGAHCDVKGEMMNSAGNIHTLFKGGDAVDICLGLDPAANPARTQPVAGDLRILIARQAEDRLVAVLYRPVVPGTPMDARTRYFTTSGGEVFIDVVKVIEDAEIAVKSDKRTWTLEARIPWKSLGVTAPTVDSHLRGDAGMLLADQNGLRTVDRWYWSGKSQTTVSDDPTEARLTPGLWGELDFVDTSKRVKGEE